MHMFVKTMMYIKWQKTKDGRPYSSNYKSLTHLPEVTSTQLTLPKLIPIIPIANLTTSCINTTVLLIIVFDVYCCVTIGCIPNCMARSVMKKIALYDRLPLLLMLVSRFLVLLFSDDKPLLPNPLLVNFAMI